LISSGDKRPNWISFIVRNGAFEYENLTDDMVVDDGSRYAFARSWVGSEKEGETKVSRTPGDGVTISRWQSTIIVSSRSNGLTLIDMKRSQR
jgi:hypothetical protein